MPQNPSPTSFITLVRFVVGHITTIVFDNLGVLLIMMTYFRYILGVSFTMRPYNYPSRNMITPVVYFCMNIFSRNVKYGHVPTLLCVYCRGYEH